MHAFALPLLVTFATLAVGQDPKPTLAPDLRALAARVELAHRPNGPVPVVTALRGTFAVELLDKAAEQRGQAELDVKYLEWQRPGSTKVLPLIRYEVRDASTPVVRGRDREGPWQLFQGTPRDLTSAEFVQDLAAYQRHSNLTRQLLRFLSPGDVLRSLHKATPVADETLAITIAIKLLCQTVQGELPAFPLLQQGGEDAPVWLKIWVNKEDGRLVAIDAWPLKDGKQDDTRGERILLSNLEVDDGILVPHSVEHLFRQPSGQLSLQSRATLRTLSLRPELRAEDFDRKK